MSDLSAAERERQLIRQARAQGTAATLWTYTRLSGPGWLQGAITLGGGSLASSLYLGVVMGYDMMWLQPVAMILGVIMLSAISYVALSTEESPFRSINQHISPLLGWGWLIATMMANIVWCLPQFALGTAALQQNLIPAWNNDAGKWTAAVGLLAVALVVVWFYNSKGRGIQIFEFILKLMVGVVVLSFFGVVIAMSWKGALDWSAIARGMIPNAQQLFSPVSSLAEPIRATGPFADWWSREIAEIQRDKIVAAFATAVGINMTFLLPFSMLRKGWGPDHRNLAMFDLSIGLIVPFVLATGCVVIASASQFHRHHADVDATLASGQHVKSYEKLLDRRLAEEARARTGSTNLAESSPQQLDQLRSGLPTADRNLAAMLAERDNFALAQTLEPLVGAVVAQKLFGIGVLGMALSTIIILMVINGFVICEIVGAPPTSNVHRWGSLIPALGVFGPFIWSEAAPALAIPTSVFGMAMLPIGYLAFLLLMNSRRVLGAAMPTGGARVRWNCAMVVATFVAMFGSIWGMTGKMLSGVPIGMLGIICLSCMLLLGIAGFVAHEVQR